MGVCELGIAVLDPGFEKGLGLCRRSDKDGGGDHLRGVVLRELGVEADGHIGLEGFLPRRCAQKYPISIDPKEGGFELFEFFEDEKGLVGAVELPSSKRLDSFDRGFEVEPLAGCNEILNLKGIRGVFSKKGNDYRKIHNLYCTQYMDIVHVASELAPIAKVGGLGDVLYGLSKASVKKGHSVCVILPKYDCMKINELQGLKVLQSDFMCEEGGQHIANTLWSAQYEGIDLVLIETHHPKHYFSRGRIYGEVDDNDRFLFLSKVASLYCEQKKTHVVHLHDWPTAA